MRKVFIFLLISVLIFNLTGFTFNDKQEHVATGCYNGMIDDNSIEVESNNEILVLRLTSNLKPYFMENILNENEYVEFKYYKNEYNQFILQYINFEINP
ncbi:hypothetical protein [Tepidibacter aestuarii]|uniref:hypothetical protein n=1 Tax=Tepidibacter aestuarii TaxID=2925782 RepID=UPI0020C06CDE|nr:hypothetical protein [Tepidibacter aestuarii]CAH2213604.1 conserved exported protein of unknown function [Tepidibacter aestuarii]